MTFPVSTKMREQDPLRRIICDAAGQLLIDESLTRRERVVAEGILDGTWRLAPNGSYIPSEKEKQAQPSATSSKPVQRSYREVLSEMFERAIVRTMDEAEVEKPINRDILNHVLAGILGVLTGVLLIAAVATILR